MKLFHDNPIFETVKSEVIVSQSETTKLSILILSRKSLNEKYKRKCTNQEVKVTGVPSDQILSSYLPDVPRNFSPVII